MHDVLLNSECKLVMGNTNDRCTFDVSKRGLSYSKTGGFIDEMAIYCRFG